MAKYFASHNGRCFRFRKELQGSEAWGPERHQQHLEALNKHGGAK